MRSPFAADQSQFLAADATLLWPAVVALFQAQGVDLSGIPAPTAVDVGTILATLNLNTFGFDPVDPASLLDPPTLRRLRLNTFEIGYKGVFEDRVSVTADLHYNDMSDVFSRQIVWTPSVFFDEDSLADYLEQFLPAESARQLAGSIAEIPVGTVTPEQAGDPTAIMLRQVQGGPVRFFGLDLGVKANLSDAWQASASYSWVSKDAVPDLSPGADFIFTNPKHRGAVSLDYQAPDERFDMRVASRFVGSFPAVSLLAASQAEAFWVADATFGYQVRRGLTLSLAVQNLFDNNYAELPGLPVVGRLILAKMGVEF